MNDISPYFRQPPSPLLRTDQRLPSPSQIEETRAYLLNFWRIVQKRLRLMLQIFFAVVLITLAVTFSLTPTYTAKTVILIERYAPRALDIRDVSPQLEGPDEYDYYKTQYEVLRSESLAVRVIKDLSLQQNANFSAERGNGTLASWWQTTRTAVLHTFQSLTALMPVPLTVNSGVDLRTIENYQRQLTIDPVPRTRLVSITFSTPDPTLSARVANAHADSFIRQGVERRSLATEEAQRFLEGKLVELKKRVEDSENALNHYRQQQGILSLDDRENVIVGRLADLNKLLTEAEADRIGLEAQAQLIRKRDYSALPAVLSSTLIQTLRAELTSLEGQYASLATQFKPGFPRLDQLKAQVDETRKRLTEEVQKVIGGIESAYLAAASKEHELRIKMEEQKAAALNLKNASVEYAILSREADTNRQLYDSVLQRLKEISIGTDARSSNVTIVDRAHPPLKPSQPKKLLNLFLGSLLGLMTGVGVAITLEYLDSTVKSPEDVQRHFLLPSLAVIPDFLSLASSPPTSSELLTASSDDESQKKRQVVKNSEVQLLPPNTKRRSRASGIVTPGVLFSRPRTKKLSLTPHPFSVVLESYRSLRTAILLSRAGEPPRTILFTSGTPGEGKSVTTLNTAIVLAQMGARVLLIDADLRHASCHKLLGIRAHLGLVELLTGQRDLHEVIQTTTTDQLFFLGGGTSVPPDPAELLGSKRMQESLALLQREYDYILIDSPPVIPVSDSLLLATMMEGVIMVVNSQQTPRYIVREAQTRLEYARAKVLGVVLNKVNMQSGEYAYYYGAYARYYGDGSGEQKAILAGPPKADI